MWPWADMIEKSAQAAADDTGVSVVPWHDWQYAGHGTTQGRLAGTIIHDTVTCYSWSDAQLLRLLRQGYTGLPGPIANVGVGPTGNLLLVAAGTAWHAGSGRWPGIPSGNLNTVGIEVANDGRQPWRPIQLRVVRRFVLHLHRAAGLPADTHIGHKEWAPSRKRDPHSVKLSTERALLRAALAETQEDQMNADQDARLKRVEELLADALDREKRPSLWRDVDATKQAVGRIDAAIPDLPGKVAAEVAASLPSGTVDADELAAKVADVLAARLRS